MFLEAPACHESEAVLAPQCRCPRRRRVCAGGGLGGGGVGWREKKAGKIRRVRWEEGDSGVVLDLSARVACALRSEDAHGRRGRVGSAETSKAEPGARGGLLGVAMITVFRK